MRHRSTVGVHASELACGQPCVSNPAQCWTFHQLRAVSILDGAWNIVQKMLNSKTTHPGDLSTILAQFLAPAKGANSGRKEGSITKSETFCEQPFAVLTSDDGATELFRRITRHAALTLILELLKAGRVAEAIPELEALSQTYPNASDVLYNLGIAYSELGCYEEAINRLQRAVQCAPNHVDAWTGLAVAHQRMGRAAHARELAQKAVDLDPKDGYARRAMGGILLNLDCYAEALVHLRVAQKALPRDANVLFCLACALDGVVGAGNKSEAQRLRLEVIRQFPESQLAAQARKTLNK